MLILISSCFIFSASGLFPPNASANLPTPSSSSRHASRFHPYSKQQTSPQSISVNVKSPQNQTTTTTATTSPCSPAASLTYSPAFHHQDSHSTSSSNIDSVPNSPKEFSSEKISMSPLSSASLFDTHSP
jgi:hypothetical protein